jgi:flagellar hook-associated protein 2
MATTTPTTTFSGLASGIDSASLIASLVQIAKAPITQLQTKQTVNTKISQKYSDLKTKLAALQTAAKALDTRTETLVNKGSSSNESIAKVTGTGGSALGKYTVAVTTMAKSQRTYSDAMASATDETLIGEGTLAITVGSGTPVNLTIVATDTLSSVAEKINGSGAGVSAGIMFDGSQYRLQVSSSATGASNAITFSDTGLGLNLSTPANTIQAATDASFTIDGFPVTSASNIVTSALPGVTVTLTGEGGSTDLLLERDPEGLKAKVDAFVTAYNDISATFNGEFTKLDGLSKTADSLSGDGTLRSLQYQLRSVLSQNWSTLSPSFPTLSSTGITLDRDNKLSVDMTKLTSSVATDYEGLAKMLTGTTTSKGLMGQISDLVDQVTGTDGAIASRIDGLSKANKDMDKSIAMIQTRIDSYQEMLTRQFAQLESVTAQLQSQGSALLNTLSKM